MKIRAIYDYINNFAAFNTALPYDNVGLLVGGFDCEVSTVLCVLDITNESVLYAKEIGAELIVSHHPVIFDPLKSLPTDNAAYLLAKYEISAICVHTNLDGAVGGVNDVLADLLGVCSTVPLPPENIGRIGDVAPVSVKEFAEKTKKALNSPYVDFIDCKKVSKIAIIGGSGGGDIDFAIMASADTLLTGEMKFSQFIEAKNRGLNVIVAGHFETENIIIPHLKNRLTLAFPSLDVKEFVIKPFKTI